MTTVVTYIEVQPGKTSQAIALIHEYRDYCSSVGSKAGLSSIEALQEIHRRNRFVTVETWADEPAFQAHEKAERVLQLRPRLREIHKCPNDQRVHTSFAASPRMESATPGVLYLVTHVDVPPPRKDETEILLRRMAEDTPKDHGCLRYDVFQQLAPRTNHFTVVEVWASEDAFASHETQPHTIEFRNALGPMLGAPYDDRLYGAL